MKKRLVITAPVPKEWLDYMQQLAREKALKERRNVSVAELVRAALQRTYDLPDDDGNS